MRASRRFRGLRAMHPGWACLTAVIVGLTTVGLVTGIARFASRGEWWNVPGVLIGSALGYWLAVPAWRLAQLRAAVDTGVASGPGPSAS